MTKTLDPNKRKAIYVIVKDEEKNLFWVEQKRPKIKDRDEFRPFWPDFDSADAIVDKICTKAKITLYKIDDNKVVSFRVRKIQNGNFYTSKQQAKDVLESIAGSLDYTITRGTISVFYDNKDFTITASDKRYPKLRRACLKDDIAKILEVLNLKAELKNSVDMSEGMKIAGHKVPNGLAKTVIDAAIGGDVKSLAKFKERMLKNPSKTAQEHLLQFLNHCGASFLEDGRFLAYKYVKDNYTDMHTGKYDYSPGKTVTMDRNKVVEDPRTACAAGLHVGTWGYSGSHTNVLLCIIDPVDVVSVPYDYAHQKIRCCKVKSVRKITKPLDNPVYPMSFVEA